MVRVRWFNSIAQLNELGERYDRFVLAAGSWGIFYRLSWIGVVWPYYRAQTRAEMAFLVAERGGDIVALAPLQIRTRNWLYANQRVLQFMGGAGDELDNWVPKFLFAEDDSSARLECASALVASILDHSGEWDQLNLRGLPVDCPSRGVFKKAFPACLENDDLNQIPMASLDGGAEVYFRSRSKRLARMLGRAERRMAEDGVCAAFKVETSLTSDRKTAIESIHRARQDQLRAAGKERTSPFDAPETTAIFWRLMAIAETCSHLRAHWLLLDGTPAAFVLAMTNAGETVLYFNGFSPDTEKYHPGVLLLSRLIEHEAGLGTNLIDFMAGRNLTKELYATHMLKISQMWAENPNSGLARVRSGVARNIGMLRAKLS